MRPQQFLSRGRLLPAALAPVLASAALLSLLLPGQAGAALGQPETSVATDAAAAHGSVKSTQRLYYRVHEVRLSSGTTLREFAAPGGTIFAVAWSGPALPDLQSTLGAYFGAYADAARAPHAVRRRVAREGADLVIESSGHMRSFRGRAYLPQALPAGVSPEELR